MREIKFRAWNKERKEMLLPTLIKLTTEGITNISCNGKDNVEYFNIGQVVELMQFTGLTDKQGQEIYEGDIYLNNENEDDLPTETVVKFEFGKFILTDRETQKRYLEDLVNIEGKVIGNIYENPELIKT